MSTRADHLARTPRRVLIEPSRGLSALGLSELWRYRELVAFFAWRDLKVRYRQTMLGVAWVLIQPLALMVLFSVVLGKFLAIDSGDVPYPVFVFVALVPWTLFSQSLTASSMSLVANAGLLGKIFFPRILLPLSSVVSYLLDFCISTLLLFGLMAVYGIAPQAEAVLLPALALLVIATALGVGIGLSALNVRYRDVQSGIPLLIQLWLFASPIAYPITIVPEGYRTLYALNPMVSVVQGFRWALLGNEPPPPAAIAASLITAVGLLLAGVVYFRRTERTFADVI